MRIIVVSCLLLAALGLRSPEVAQASLGPCENRVHTDTFEGQTSISFDDGLMLPIAASVKLLNTECLPVTAIQLQSVPEEATVIVIGLLKAMDLSDSATVISAYAAPKVPFWIISKSPVPDLYRTKQFEGMAPDFSFYGDLLRSSKHCGHEEDARHLAFEFSGRTFSNSWQSVVIKCKVESSMLFLRMVNWGDSSSVVVFASDKPFSRAQVAVQDRLIERAAKVA
jgi:hypothetical protein